MMVVVVCVCVPVFVCVYVHMCVCLDGEEVVSVVYRAHGGRQEFLESDV